MAYRSVRFHRAVPQGQEHLLPRRNGHHRLLRAMTLVAAIVASAAGMVACGGAGSTASAPVGTAAQVFGLYTIELKPGVTEADLAKAVAQMERDHFRPGWHILLLKADRGENAGKYLVMFQIESLAARNRFTPTADQISPEAEQLLQAHPYFIEPLIASSSFLGDYIVVTR